jgi:hypothetical protein
MGLRLGSRGYPNLGTAPGKQDQYSDFVLAFRFWAEELGLHEH